MFNKIAMKIFYCDAFINLSTLVGIIITAILIPIALNISEWHKRLLAKNILMSKLNSHLNVFVPHLFREININTYYKFRVFGTVLSRRYLPFSINEDYEEINKYFYQRLKNKNQRLKYKENLINTRTDLMTFLSTYGDVVNKKILREFYWLDDKVQTCEHDSYEYDDFNLECYAQDITGVIGNLNEMRKLLLKKYVVANPPILIEN